MPPPSKQFSFIAIDLQAAVTVPFPKTTTVMQNVVYVQVLVRMNLLAKIIKSKKIDSGSFCLRKNDKRID